MPALLPESGHSSDGLEVSFSRSSGRITGQPQKNPSPTGEKPMSRSNGESVSWECDSGTKRDHKLQW